MEVYELDNSISESRKNTVPSVFLTGKIFLLLKFQIINN